jgi:hypothetical protein
MRATERQRGSGQQLRRQYAVWPGNALNVHQNASAREITRALIGSFWIALLSAARA